MVEWEATVGFGLYIPLAPTFLDFSKTQTFQSMPYYVTSLTNLFYREMFEWPDLRVQIQNKFFLWFCGPSSKLGNSRKWGNLYLERQMSFYRYKNQ